MGSEQPSPAQTPWPPGPGRPASWHERHGTIGHRPQSRAVLLLSVALAAMLLLWAVGAYVLLAHTPEFGELPGATPAPSVTQ